MAEPELTPSELLAAYNQRFTDPVPPEAGPFQQILPEEETYRDMAERNLAGMLGDDREAFRRAGTFLRTADEMPILGDVTAFADVGQAIQDRDPVGIGIGALGFIPGMAGMARRGSDGGNNFLEELRRKRQEFRDTELREARAQEIRAQERMAEDSQAILKKNEINAYNTDLDIAEQALREAEAKEMNLSIQLRDELPDDIIKRDAQGNPLSEEEFRKANVMGFHGTRNATERIYEQGSVASKREGDIVSVEDAAFFHGDAPLPAKTFGQTIVPARIDTREFVTVDMDGNSYMEDPLKGTNVIIDSPVEIEVLGKKAKRHKIPAGILTYQQNTGEFTDQLITDLKKQGIPGAVLKNYTDIDPAGAVLHFTKPKEKELRSNFFDPKNNITQEVIVVLDRSKQRLAKGNPSTLYDPDALSHRRAMDPESGFNQGGQVQKLANGGMVTGMNRSPQAGPLARQVVPRETMAPMGYNTGGSVFQPGQQSLQPSTRQDLETFLASNPPDKYGRQYGGQQYGEDVYQNTPESFKLMAEEAGFGDMPAVYSGMVDSQDIPGGIDPVTGKQWGGGSVGLQRRQKLAKYFEQNPGAKEFWQSNFGEKAPPEGFGGPDQGLFQGGPQFGLVQELDSDLNSVGTPIEAAPVTPAPVTPALIEPIAPALIEPVAPIEPPASVAPVTPPPAPPPPLAVEAAQEQEPSMAPPEVTESLSPSSSQYGGIGGLQGFVQFIQMLPTMAQLYQQIRGGGQGFSSGFNTPYSGFNTGGNYGGSSPYQHARSYQTGGGVDVPMPTLPPGLEQPLDERFTQPGPYEMGPLQQIIPEEETYRDMVERNLAGALGDDREAYRRAGKLLDTADQIPVLGDATAAADVMQAVKDVDPMGLGIAAAGVIPGGKNILGKVREFLKENFTHDRTPQYPMETFPRHRMQPLPLEDPNVKYDPFRESFDFEKNVGRQAASFPEHDKELLQRAKEQGFNTDQVLYHYTKQFEKGPDGKPGELTTIKPSKSGSYGPGVYLSPDPFYAQRYALDEKDVKKFGGGARAIPVVVRGKLANTTDFMEAMNQAQKEINKITKTFSPEKIKIAADDILRQKGFSGKQVNMYGENEFVVFDSKDIRSINAKFDPDFKDSADLLKAQGGEVQSFQTGGTVFGMPNFMGRVYGVPDQEEATAAETLAATPAVTTTSATSTNQGTLPSGLSPLQKRLIASGELQLEDLGYPKGSYDPVVTSVFETTPTASEELIEETQEPVVTDPVVTTTEEPVVETTTEPVVTTTEPVVTTTEPIVETTEPLTPFETTTQETLVEPTVVETTTEPTAETVTTTEPVVDTAPLVVTEPLASEELASTTAPVEEEPVVLVPSPTEDDVTTFTVQEQPDAPDEQPFVPITGVSPDLSVNQYLDTTYQTGYPTTQGMEIKESLIPGQEYSAERLAAGQMIDVIRPDLGSGADLPSVDFSNINFDSGEDEELEVVDYEKPEVGMLSAEMMDVDAYNSYMQRPEMKQGQPVNWKTAGEGLADFVSNPLRALSDIPIQVADRIWAKRPAFILATYARDKQGNLLRNENGEFYRRDGLGTLINRILDNIDDGRSNRFFREYNEETGQLEGQNWLQRLLGTQEGTDVSDKTEDGQRNFRTMLMDGLTAGLQMMNPLNMFKTTETDQQFEQTPAYTLADGTPIYTYSDVLIDADKYQQHLDVLDNTDNVMDRAVAYIVGLVDDSAWQKMSIEERQKYVTDTLPGYMENKLKNSPEFQLLKSTGVLNELIENEIPVEEWAEYTKDWAATEVKRAETIAGNLDRADEIKQDVARARGRDELGTRIGSIDAPGSGFSTFSGSMGGNYLGPGGDFFPDRISGSGRLPSASGSWGGLNPFFESPQPGDPMYADFLMDTMGPGKNFENEIQGMVDAQVPFFEAVGEDGRYYLMSKETGEVLYGPYDNPNTGGGSPSPGGGMADGGPVVRNVGETEGIAGLFEDMMGPGTVDETERVYKYPGGTMTERVSRGSFNMRTG